MACFYQKNTYKWVFFFYKSLFIFKKQIVSANSSSLTNFYQVFLRYFLKVKYTIKYRFIPQAACEIIWSFDMSSIAQR